MEPVFQILPSTPISLKKEDSMEVAPVMAKFAPFLKSASFDLDGSGNGNPNFSAVYMVNRKIEKKLKLNVLLPYCNGQEPRDCVACEKHSHAMQNGSSREVNFSNY
jgi:hypothetical protein